MNDTRRITLINLGPATPDRDWNCASDSPSRLIFLESATTFRVAMFQTSDIDLDIERLILDCGSTPREFLDLLASLPAGFHADVLYVRDDEGGYLSSLGRGGDRVIYSLTAFDVRFYLETHGLVTKRMAVPEQMTAKRQALCPHFE